MLLQGGPFVVTSRPLNLHFFLKMRASLQSFASFDTRKACASVRESFTVGIRGFHSRFQCRLEEALNGLVRKKGMSLFSCDYDFVGLPKLILRSCEAMLLDTRYSTQKIVQVCSVKDWSKS